MTAIPRGQTPERRAYMKAYAASHPARKRDPEDKARHDANYREKNKDALSQKKKAWYRKNRDAVLARVKRRSVEKREDILEYQAAYYAENTEKVKSNVYAYRAANPEKKSHLENRRRARKFLNGGSHTLQERQEKFALLGNVCYYCKRPLKLTVDHDVPLSRGGTDNIENILPACHSCNSKKSAQTASEFLSRIWTIESDDTR